MKQKGQETDKQTNKQTTLMPGIGKGVHHYSEENKSFSLMKTHRQQELEFLIMPTIGKGWKCICSNPLKKMKKEVSRMLLRYDLSHMEVAVTVLFKAAVTRGKNMP